MRIIFIALRLLNGGSERALTAFANALVEIGQEVHIIDVKNEGTDYAIDERVNVHAMSRTSNVRIPKIRGLCNMLAPATQLRRLSGDVIIPFYPPSNHHIYLRFYLATIFSKTRILYAVRNNQERKLDGKKERRKMLFASFLADAIWVQAEGQRQFFPKFMGKKIFEVHNIIDNRFLDIPRTDRGKICNFISVGRLHPQKNQKMLIQAFADMIERTGNRDATLTVYGRAEKSFRYVETELRDLIQHYGLEDRIFLPGRVTDIETKYTEADAFVFGSDYEGCPNALMEAMAAGLPCVSTDCPTGPSELIDNSENGLLVPVGDVEAMSLAMEYLIENPQEASRMGMAARQRMREWGSPEKLAGELVTQLKRICS